MLIRHGVGADAGTKKLAPVRDPARLVKLDFEIAYEECDLAPKHYESKPVLQMYLSSHFVRDAEAGGVVNIHLDEDNLRKRYVGSLVGTLRREYGSTLPLNAPIGLCSYAIHHNDIGTPCYVDVGTSYALVGDVVAECKQRGAYAHSHELLMRQVAVTGEEPLKKGVIGLRFTNVELGSAIRLPSKLPALGTQQLVLERIAATEAREQTVSEYVRATMAHEQRFPDSMPNVGRVRVPMDISQTGISSTGRMFMPIAAYAMVETPRANADFFVNAFERVLARWNMKRNAYSAFDIEQKARTMAKIIAYPVQSLDYIGDAHYAGRGRQARKLVEARGGPGASTAFNANDAPVLVPDESMFNALVASSGDCEDLNTAAVAIMKAFISMQFDASKPEHQPLIEMQAIAREYIPISALAVVHGAKIGDEEGYGAHMYLPLLPKKQFFDGLSRTSDGRAMLEKMQAPAKEPTGVFAQVGALEPPHELPSLFIEGTGIIDVLGYKDPILRQRREVAMHMPSLKGMKMEIPHERGAPSPFYYAIMNGITDHFVQQEGIPVAGFVVGQVNPKYNPRIPQQAHEMTRGAIYEDVLNMSNKLAIAPQPEIPHAVMQVIREGNALRPPIPDQVLDRSKPMEGPARDRHLDVLVKGVRAMGRAPPAKPPAGSVDVIVRPHQYGAAKIAQLLKEASAFDALYDVTYEKEQITNKSYTYRVQLWVK